jgi:SNF2-related domain
MNMKSRSGKTLRPPQSQSVTNILHVWQHGALVGEGSARGPVLADSMGLGKTATAVVAAFKARMRRVLVVCPKSELPDWLREIDDWHPRPAHRRARRRARAEQCRRDPESVDVNRVASVVTKLDKRQGHIYMSPIEPPATLALATGCLMPQEQEPPQ